MILPSGLSPICFIAHLLSFNTGSARPAFVGLGLRETLVILTIVDITTCAVPAFFTVFGPKLGMRAMIQSRFPGAAPSWTTGFENGDNISSLISAVLSPIDGFGKFMSLLHGPSRVHAPRRCIHSAQVSWPLDLFSRRFCDMFLQSFLKPS